MKKIWLKSYPENVPSEIHLDTHASLIDLFHQVCFKYKNHVAWLNQGAEITYEGWYAKSRDFAAYLQGTLHLKKGDRFALMLPNILQYPVVLFGALLAGLIVVNVNPRYTVSELVHQLNDSGAETLIVLANLTQVLQEALPQTPVKQVFITEFADLFPFPRSRVINFLLKYVLRKVPRWREIPGIETLSFKDTLLLGEKLPLTAVPLTSEDIAFLQYTGGSTGVAKGAILTHGNLLANVEQATWWVSSILSKGKEIIITALPLYHIFSLTANAFVFMRQGGCNVLITDPRNMKGFIQQLKKVNFTVITGVNTLFNALLNNPAFAKLNFSHLRLSLSGGMATQHAVAERWQKVTGNVLTEAYGLTEASPAVAINPMNLSAYNGSIGLPIPSTDIKLCDDHEKEVPLGEPGELYIKGPQVMRGYWHAPIETEHAFTKDGWLKTGDIATMDPAGFLRIVDRKKDMIIVSGFNVYPNEIEDVLTGHPDVLEAAVIGRPDTQTGEAVWAYVVPKTAALTAQKLIDYCHQHLTEYKVPHHIVFRDSLPKSNIGKILRRALRAEPTL